MAKTKFTIETRQQLRQQLCIYKYKKGLTVFKMEYHIVKVETNIMWFCDIPAPSQTICYNHYFITIYKHTTPYFDNHSSIFLCNRQQS